METRTVAWIGAGTDMQAQKDELLAYAEDTGIHIDRFNQAQPEEDKPPPFNEELSSLFADLQSGDTFIVSSLSILGRSIHEAIRIINRILDMDVRIIAVRQGLTLASNGDITSRSKVELLRMLHDVQKDIVSRRTRHGLDARKKAGTRLGRPKGSTGKSKLDPHKKEIAQMLRHKAPLSYIARVYGVTWPTVENFIRTRNL